jgi:hypothetical protein
LDPLLPLWFTTNSQGIAFCSPAPAATARGACGLADEQVTHQLLVSPGCAFWLWRPKAEKLGLVGEIIPTKASNFAFPWTSWENFLQLAGAHEAEDPALDWHPLGVPSGTALPDVVTLARDAMGLRD